MSSCIICTYQGPRWQADENEKLLPRQTAIKCCWRASFCRTGQERNVPLRYLRVHMKHSNYALAPSTVVVWRGLPPAVNAETTWCWRVRHILFSFFFLALLIIFSQKRAQRSFGHFVLVWHHVAPFDLHNHFPVPAGGHLVVCMFILSTATSEIHIIPNCNASPTMAGTFLKFVLSRNPNEP